jgi:hypothetical protein
MVEVFKTDISEIADAEQLIALLLHHFPGSKINVDLEDCDKVLRMEGNDIPAEKVMRLVNESGFYCGLLE